MPTLLLLFRRPDRLSGRVSILLRDDDEHEVPLEWRAPFAQIVEAFLRDDLELSDHPVSRADSAELKTAENIVSNINAYGAPLASLNAATWERSVYRWMDGYWLFLVDLTTANEEVSDLTLHARLRDDPEARLEVQSVHVL